MRERVHGAAAWDDHGGWLGRAAAVGPAAPVAHPRDRPVRGHLHARRRGRPLRPGPAPPPGPARPAPAQPVPVLAWGAATGLDSGEPRWRRKMESTMSAATARNSLCQFCMDWNQNWE